MLSTPRAARGRPLLRATSECRSPVTYGSRSARGGGPDRIPSYMHVLYYIVCIAHLSMLGTLEILIPFLQPRADNLKQVAEKDIASQSTFVEDARSNLQKLVDTCKDRRLPPPVMLTACGSIYM